MAKPARTILVCDDEAHIRQIIGHKLRGAGLNVVEARNGHEALGLLDGPSPVRPGLIITDFQMPILTGLEFCKILRQRPDTGAIPVLMLTARGYVLTDAELAQTNIRQVIGKPFGVRQLLERVLETLGPAAQGPGLLAA